MHSIRNRDDLVDYVNQGNRVKYVFFWGHQKPKSGVGKTCFSQWYDSPFESDGITYQTAEHYMMAEKARLFGDPQAAEKVIAAGTPGEAKKVGRGVRGFDDKIWQKHRFNIVVKANLLKFSQNPELKEFLLSTGKRVLVEASPVDRIWGIGLAADDNAAENPNRWKGLNLLGFALMEVRSQLAAT
ncbi:NADAR family protein [Hahella ganghwensis]|uniref:NADAR family protein n=1 Tax=Hahella ganghwensis TaxID=286420 RepID=UPI0003814038|nr:NADAR family protein [Hahella ganghwensis]